MANEARISASIDIVLYAINHQKWPTDHKLFVSFDYTNITEIYKYNKTIRYPEMVHPLIAKYNESIDLNALQI